MVAHKFNTILWNAMKCLAVTSSKHHIHPFEAEKKREAKRLSTKNRGATNYPVKCAGGGEAVLSFDGRMTRNDLLHGRAMQNTLQGPNRRLYADIVKKQRTQKFAARQTTSKEHKEDSEKFYKDRKSVV